MNGKLDRFDEIGNAIGQVADTDFSGLADVLERADFRAAVTSSVGDGDGVMLVRR